MRLSFFLFGAVSGCLATLVVTGSVKVHWDTPLLVKDVGQLAHAQTKKALKSEQIVDKNQPTITVQPPVSTPTLPTPAVPSIDYSATFVELMKSNHEKWQIADPAISPDESRARLYAFFQQAPALVIGNSDKIAYVLFEPNCPHCHRFFNTSSAMAEKLGIQFNWIPVIAFVNNNSSIERGLKLQTALNAQQPKLAIKAYSAMINGDTRLIDDQRWVISEDAWDILGQQTYPFLQIGTGTPTILFKTDQGIEILGGVPDEEDEDDLSSIQS